MGRQVRGFLASCTVFCAFRWVDLALWTDLSTGLIRNGHVWLRYAALFAWAAAALATGHLAADPAGQLARPAGRGAAFALSLPAFAAGVCFGAQGVLDIIQAAGPADIVQGALYALSALWLECLGQYWLTEGLVRPGRKASAPPPAWLGVAGSLAFVWGVLRSFMTNGSSWQRTIPTSAAWQQLAALLLLAAVLRAVCLPGAANPRAAGRYGLLAALLCAAWQLPRCVLLPAGPGDWALVALGLLGAGCALACAGETGAKGARAAD